MQASVTPAETPRRAANGLYTHCHVCGKQLRYGGLTPKVVCSRECYRERRRIERRVVPTSRDCEHCGLAFTPRRRDARFCGAACRQRAHRAAAR